MTPVVSIVSLLDVGLLVPVVIGVSVVPVVCMVPVLPAVAVVPVVPVVPVVYVLFENSSIQFIKLFNIQIQIFYPSKSMNTLLFVFHSLTMTNCFRPI